MNASHRRTGDGGGPPGGGPPPDHRELAGALDLLWRRHRDTNLDRIAMVESVAAAVLRGTIDEALRSDGERAAHKLTGALGTFGFATGSDAARDIESMLRAGGYDPLSLADAVVTLRDAVVDSAAFDSAMVDRPVGAVEPASPVGTDPAGVLPSAGVGDMLVVSADADLVARVTIEAATRGWRTEAVGDAPESAATAGPAVPGRVPREALRALRDRSVPPRVIVVDVGAGAAFGAGAGVGGGAGVEPRGADPVHDLIGDLRALAAVAPTIVLADPGPTPDPANPADPAEADRVVAPRFATLRFAALRLAVARSGAVGLLDRSGQAREAVAFAETAVPGPVTVLAVRTGAVFDALYPDLSRFPGCRVVSVVDDPLWWERVAQTRPDVVLLEEPSTCGQAEPGVLDRCAMLRCDPRWRGTPIIVLRAAPARGTRVRVTDDAVLAAGADDVMTAPRDASALWSRIRMRAERCRVLARTSARPAVEPPIIQAVAAAFTPAAATPDVVVVEDDDSVADVVIHALTLRGLRSHRITSGVEAVEALCGGRLRARLIVLDVGLPGLDGFGVLGRLREAGVLARTPVMVLTARSTEAETLTALGLGAAEHLTKPFSVPILISRIERMLIPGDER